MDVSQPLPTPARDAVGAALRFAREAWRFVLLVAVIGAFAATLLLAMSLASPPLSIVGGVARWVVEAFVYATLTAAALAGAPAVRAGLLANGARVFAAMVVVGFLLFIVLVVVSIPVSIVLASGPLVPYLADLERAGGDQQRVLAIMLRFMQENPAALGLVVLFFSAVWMYLTSRLYLAVPASVDQKRILTFETWSWTKGATLRILYARILLLAPAFALTFALTYLIAVSVGINPADPSSSVATANSAAVLFYSFATAVVTFAVYMPLEAGLSAALYRQLKQTPPPAG